jgi:multiple sugar transport system ATP-binding protein
VPAAYALARYKFRGKEDLAFTFLSFRFAPELVVIIPLSVIYRQLGLYDTYFGIMWVYQLVTLPLLIWVLRSYFEDISPDIEQAAMLDGYSWWHVFFKILMPLVRPGLAAAALLAFIFAWNNFMFPLVLGGSNVQTVTVACARLHLVGAGLLQPHGGGLGVGVAAADHPGVEHPALSHSWPQLWRRERLNRIMATLRLEHLTKDFGKVRAVNDLSLDVEDGEFIVMLGPSGAGKTTTLKLIAGVETPTTGKVYIGDKLMNAVEPHYRNVAMAFESYALYPHMTVKENLSFPLRAPGQKFSAGRDRPPRHRRLRDAQHPDADGRLPQHLSNGQKQRVALGRAMVREPNVLLLDEPISHLDAKLRHRMRQEFKALEADIRYTTIYVTHDYLEALSLGDRLVMLNQGVIQQIGPPHEVFEKPANLWVSKILGHPQINLIECGVHRSDDALELVSRDGAIRVTVPETLRAPLLKQGADRYTLGIRPMHLHVVSATGDTTNTCNGVVYVFERLGTRAC